ncbi:Lipid droplet-associated hydrolase [Trypanosoma melophagium]|uniref:Lipid droplet-associated hydrolase n=1 Tax=Trypanosoma melophagium TaxID=715481 RepID=UPI00351AB103|nr:Lipid droplet-associated hydrolase [Trypanosoma melophagium]
MSFPNAIVTWQCPLRPSPVVEVLQSCQNLLDYLCDVSSAEFMRRPPSPNRKLFILFPGNPGVVHFYERFVQLMSMRRVDVLVMGYAGHSFIDQNYGGIFDLQDQVDAAEQFLITVLTGPTIKWYGNHIYIGGHSIGAFVAMQMVARFPCIKRCFSLCGALSNLGKSPNGERMFFLGGNIIIYKIATYVVMLLLLMPKIFFSLFISWNAPEMEPSLQQMVATHLNRYALLNSLAMCRQEFHQVRNLDKALLKSVQKRMVFYYVANDKWVPLDYAYEVKETCEGNAGFVVEEDSKVPHSWCLAHNEAVIENGIMPFI